MITIAPLQSEQVAAAKLVIVTVARPYFAADKTVDEFAAMLDEGHDLHDMDQFQDVYCRDGALFLGVMDDERLVGTGAIKPHDQDNAELKRLWLLEEYHGQGLGYQLIQRLFEFARQVGYKRVVLQTDIKQERAIAFYKRLGFVEIPVYTDLGYADDISMAVSLDP